MPPNTTNLKMPLSFEDEVSKCAKTPRVASQRREILSARSQGPTAEWNWCTNSQSGTSAPSEHNAASDIQFMFWHQALPRRGTASKRRTWFMPKTKKQDEPYRTSQLADAAEIWPVDNQAFADAPVFLCTSVHRVLFVQQPNKSEKSQSAGSPPTLLELVRVAAQTDCRPPETTDEPDRQWKKSHWFVLAHSSVDLRYNGGRANKSIKNKESQSHTLDNFEEMCSSSTGAKDLKFSAERNWLEFEHFLSWAQNTDNARRTTTLLLFFLRQTQRTSKHGFGDNTRGVNKFASSA